MARNLFSLSKIINQYISSSILCSQRDPDLSRASRATQKRAIIQNGDINSAKIRPSWYSKDFRLEWQITY